MGDQEVWTNALLLDGFQGTKHCEQVWLGWNESFHKAEQRAMNALPKDSALIAPGLVVAREKALQQGERQEGKLWYQRGQRPGSGWAEPGNPGPPARAAPEGSSGGQGLRPRQRSVEAGEELCSGWSDRLCDD